MSGRMIGGAGLVLALAACAGMQRDPDPTPVNPTAILETRTTSSGLQDSPAFEATIITQTRANMQRAESRFKGTGTITRFLDVDSGVRIERIDRKIAWSLDAKAKQAAECPLKGCPIPAPKKLPGTPPAATEIPRNTDCRMRVGTTAITIDPTGQKRTISGFDTEQYNVKWVVTLRDNASRRSTSTISLDVWTAATTADLRDAIALEKAFVRARDKALGTDTEAERTGLLPAEAARAITAYLAPNVSPSDRGAFLSGSRKLDKVKGVPVLTTVKWSLAGDACALEDTATDTGEKSLFTFTSEVKVHKMEAKHDSLFVPPKDYKITK